MHAYRIAARQRRVRTVNWAAALLTAFIVGLGLGAAQPSRAQDFSVGANGLGNAGYPTGSQPFVVGATGTTGAVTATIPAVPGRVGYLCGIHIDATGSGSIGPITAGPFVGPTPATTPQTMTFQATAGAASNPVQTMSPFCLPGSAPNTAINVTTTADGTATAVDVNIWGFYQ